MKDAPEKLKTKAVFVSSITPPPTDATTPRKTVENARESLKQVFVRHIKNKDMKFTPEQIPPIYRMPEKGDVTKLQTTKIKPTKYGFRLQRFSSYVTQEFISVYILDNGFCYCKGVHKRNYCKDSYSTEYFDRDGNRVKTRKEWLKLQNQ